MPKVVGGLVGNDGNPNYKWLKQRQMKTNNFPFLGNAAGKPYTQSGYGTNILIVTANKV